MRQRRMEEKRGKVCFWGLSVRISEKNMVGAPSPFEKYYPSRKTYVLPHA